MPVNPCGYSASGGSCQFESLGLRTFEQEDGWRCLLHCSVESLPDKVAKALKHAVEKNITDFDGVYFPAERGDITFSAGDDQLVSFRGCTFGKDFVLDLRGLSNKAIAVVKNITMQGELTVHLPSGKFDVSGETFPHKLVVSPLDSRLNNHKFNNCKFFSSFRIDGQLTGIWDFSGAVFFGDTQFARGNKDLVEPGATVRMFRTVFERSACNPDAEGKARLLREAFTDASDRDNEAVFYQLEKRCQRFGLPLGFTRGTSALYDWLSSYGSSYVKPFILFVALQLIAGAAYAGASKNYELALGADFTVPAFTLAQTVKPFELFGARAHSKLFLSVVDANETTLWALVTFLHGLLSLALLAMFLLALRWRFKRN